MSAKTGMKPFLLEYTSGQQVLRVQFFYSLDVGAPEFRLYSATKPNWGGLAPEFKPVSDLRGEAALSEATKYLKYVLGELEIK